jgi:NAD+ diphosphatase
MFQDIQPNIFNNAYRKKEPQKTDYLVIYKNDSILIDSQQGTIPKYDLIEKQALQLTDVTYLFSVNDTSFYLSLISDEVPVGYSWENMNIFREFKPGWIAFAGASACHIAKWYADHRFCGRCAAKTIHSEKERALVCPSCGLIEYPRISPVVIVGITCGDNILLTKYSRGNYKNYALIAGFVEFGETLEEAAKREVKEEVGLAIKKIRYFKSQPWAFSQSLLSGFFAEVDGSTEVILDKQELSEAKWFKRSELTPRDASFSLTWEMIEVFRCDNG